MKTSKTAILYLLVSGIVWALPAAAQQDSKKLPEAPPAKAQSPAPATASPFKDQKEKISYAVGMFLASRVRPQADEFDPNTVAQGLKDGLSGGKSLMTEEEAMSTLSQWQNEMRAKEAEKKKAEGETNEKEGEAFLAANKAKPDVVTLPSGLQYKILTPGAGPKPTASDTVSCNYKGTLINGKEFDSSAKHGGPISFPVGGVIKGWTEALQLMPVGSKWQLFIPSSLAYGERGSGADIGPNATLVFEVELVSIQSKEPAKENPPAK